MRWEFHEQGDQQNREREEGWEKKRTKEWWNKIDQTMLYTYVNIP